MTQPARGSDSYQIRVATVDDAVAVIAVIFDAGSMFRDIEMAEVSDNPPPAVEDVRAQLQTGQTWLATHGDRIVGCIVVDGDAHIDQVSTARSHQGRGVGRRLVETAEDWARGQGCRRVTLTTFTDVSWNAPYYRWLGYRVLAADELGGELAAVRAAEAALGLDAWGRCVMARDLPVGSDL